VLEISGHRIPCGQRVGGNSVWAVCITNIGSRKRWHEKVDKNQNDEVFAEHSPYCALVARLSLDGMAAIAACRGGRCLSTEYRDVGTPLL
jgi:hypothetical protein